MLTINVSLTAKISLIRLVRVMKSCLLFYIIWLCLKPNQKEAILWRSFSDRLSLEVMRCYQTDPALFWYLCHFIISVGPLLFIAKWKVLKPDRWRLEAWLCFIFVLHLYIKCHLTCITNTHTRVNICCNEIGKVIVFISGSFKRADGEHDAGHDGNNPLPGVPFRGCPGSACPSFSSECITASNGRREIK